MNADELTTTAQAEKMIKAGWKSPDDCANCLLVDGITKKQIQRDVAAAREDALREVGDMLAGKDWFGEKMTANQRVTVLEYIKAGKFSGKLKSGRMPGQETMNQSITCECGVITYPPQDVQLGSVFICPNCGTKWRLIRWGKAK